MADEQSSGAVSIELKTVVLECRDARALADFYIRLLGWQLNDVEEGEWVDIAAPSGGVKIAFQQNADYVPPVWPEQPGEQQQMAHLDFAVQDPAHLEQAARYAISYGAKRAEVQHGGDEWVTLIDPEGHPFCFVS